MNKILKQLRASLSQPGLSLLKLIALSFSLCGVTSEGYSATLPPGQDGLRIGSGRVHGFVEGETHYVYNPHRTSTNAFEDLRGTQGTMFSLRPGVNYLARSSTLEIHFQGHGDLRHYTAPYLAGHQNFFGGDARLSLHLNKESSLPIRITTRALRSDVPANQGISRSLTNQILSLELDGHWKPGGGALTVQFRAPVAKHSYDDTENENHSKLNNLKVQPSLQVAWRKFPKTAFTLRVFSDFTKYDPGAYSENIDFLGGQVGLTGAVTSRISAILRGGWTTPILATDLQESASGFAGLFELGYKLSNALTISLGGGREIRAAPLFNYHKDIFGSLKANLNVGTQVNIDFGFEARRLDYGTPSPDKISTLLTTFQPRNDYSLKPSLIISYFINDWLTLSLHNRYEYRNTGDFTVPMYMGEATGSYNYYDAFLRVGARY